MANDTNYYGIGYHPLSSSQSPLIFFFLFNNFIYTGKMLVQDNNVTLSANLMLGVHKAGFRREGHIY